MVGEADAIIPAKGKRMFHKSDPEPPAPSNTPMAQAARLGLLVVGQLGCGAAALCLGPQLWGDKAVQLLLGVCQAIGQRSRSSGLSYLTTSAGRE